MGTVKILKNKAFYKRFQVKRKRRLSGKTDFRARRKMVRQDKNKFNTRKYRLIVRFTNRKVICQVAYATIHGDKMVAHATSADLDEFGVKIGHTNYAAAYCTGLLIARRVLHQFNLHEKFKGKETIDGEDYHVEDEKEGEQKPFKAILDVGIRRTTLGSRMWGALKGAVDGGLHVPHNSKNFPGFKAAESKGAQSEYDAEAHKERIFGGHVKEYMEMLQEEDPTKYQAHFSKFHAADVEPDGIEEMYADAHKKIRENPVRVPADKTEYTFERKGGKLVPSDGDSYTRNIKLTLKQRRGKVAQKIAKAQREMAAEAEEDE